VTADSGADQVSVLLGNPDGTFQPAGTSATGPSPQSVAVGDFNGDGNLDLATGNYDYISDYGYPGVGANDVSILLGHGDGTFADPVQYSVPDASRSIAVGDMDGNGALDLVVTSSDPYGAVSHVSVLLGQGDGSFAPAATSGPTYGTHFYSLALADFDGDGNTDVAVTDSSQAKVKLLLGTPNGVLQSPIEVANSVSVFSLSVGDFDADQKVDLVTINSSGSAASVLLGSGDGTFQAGQPFAAGVNPRAPAAADIDGDGLLDLVVTNLGTTGAVSVLLGNGNGSFDLPIAAAAGFNPVALVIADFNGDRRLDAAAVNLGSHNVSVLISDGVWSAVEPPRISISDVTKKEGNGKKTTLFTFTVTLSAACDQPVTMSYRTVDGTATSASGDYIAKIGTLTFAPGETVKTITIEVKGDNKREANETFYLDLFGLSTNALFTRNRGIGTILNDD
jgi:hypothetical protein